MYKRREVKMIIFFRFQLKETKKPLHGVLCAKEISQITGD